MPRFLRPAALLVLLAACGRSQPPAVTPTPEPAPATAEEPAEPAVDPSLQVGDSRLRLAIDDVLRLDIARSVREPEEGLLRLELGRGFHPVTSEYNLRMLYSAYVRYRTLREEPPVMELLRDGATVARYTERGLDMEGAEGQVAEASPEEAAPGTLGPGTERGRRRRPYLSIGGGGGVADFTCDNCQFEMSTAPSGFVAAGIGITPSVVLAVEGTGWTKTDDRGRGTIYSAMLTATSYVLDNQPVFVSLGMGYIGFKRPVPEGTYRADGLGFSARAGVDLGVGGSVALSPYFGFVGSFGNRPFELDGNASPLEASIRNLQFGVAFTLR
jgi:hypothetical protein